MVDMVDMAMFDLGLHFEVGRSDMPHVSQGKNNMKLLSCRHVADIDAAYLVSHIQWLQCLSRQSAYGTYLKVPTQSRQRNTLPSSIMWKVPITWRAALARIGRVKLAHVPRLGRALLPRSIANVSPACTMLAHRRTLTPRCT